MKIKRWIDKFPSREISIALLLLIPSVSAWGQSLVWTTKAGGVSHEFAHSIVVDGSDHSYVTGDFQGIATFGAGEANQTTLSSVGSRDIFIAKYDDSGSLLWAKQAGGYSNDSGAGIAVDNVGNSYVIGRFEDNATFGVGETNETALTSAGSNDIFVAKYDANGALQWVSRAGGPGNDRGLGIAVDLAGNSYVTGTFPNGNMTLGLTEVNETTLTSVGASELFVANYDTNGTLLWAAQGNGSFADEGNDIAVDSGGSCYLTGSFEGTVTFGAGEPNETTLTSDYIDIFVVKYGSSGDLLWAKKAGGTDRDRGYAIGIDGSGNSYVTGSYEGSAIFGMGEANETTLPSAGVGANSEDTFVAKYDSGGSLLWATKASATSYDDYGLGIDVDALGNSYVIGRFEDNMIFGAGEANETTLNGVGVSDVFVAKYDMSGGLFWAIQIGGTSNDFGTDIAVNDAGNSFATGGFSTSATFGAGEINETTLTSSGGTDIYVARFAPALLMNNVMASEPFIATNPVAINNSVLITAILDDSATGGSNIVAGTLLLNNSSIFMNPTDGAYDSPKEMVDFTLPAFSEAGIHNVCVLAEDEEGNVSDPQCTLLVVYDPDGGFVTGGGWINTPAGSYPANPALTGKANFGFVAKYQKNSTIPTGQTEFQFQAAGLNFHSTSYEWLVVAGAKAQFKGTGTVNGESGYGFMLIALDAALTSSTSTDRFRIKIWDISNEDAVVYDNQIGEEEDADPTTDISGGSIIIHKPKN